jgi:hypothetical protein
MCRLLCIKQIIGKSRLVVGKNTGKNTPETVPQWKKAECGGSARHLGNYRILKIEG